jgi:hypothetical protein
MKLKRMSGWLVVRGSDDSFHGEDETIFTQPFSSLSITKMCSEECPMPDMSNPRGTKRTYEELRQELAQRDHEIHTLTKKQRTLTKELATYPEEQKRIDEIIAKERAEDNAKYRALIDATLPEGIAKTVLDEPGRKAFPEYGSLLSISVRPTLLEIDRLSKADAVEVCIQFEKGSRFFGIIFPETRTTIPSMLCGVDVYDDVDSDESDSDDWSYSNLDRWQRALKYHDNNPIMALFALIARGVIELHGTDKEITDEDDDKEMMKKVWRRVFYVKLDYRHSDGEEKESE